LAYNTLKIFFSILTSSVALGASCCGGGVGGQSLILNDALVKYSYSYSNTTYLEDVDAQRNQVARTKSGFEVKEIFSFGYARGFSSYQQIGTEINAVKITKGEGGNSKSKDNIGDLKLFYGYEFLPEIYYSAWKPRGFLSLSLNIPLGKSKYDYETTAGEDISGSGFYSLSLASTMIKTINRHQITFSLGFLKSFPKYTDKGKVDRSLGYNTSVSYGLSSVFNLFDFSTSVGRDMAGRDEINKVSSSDSYETYFTIGLSHEINESNTIVLTYKDSANISGQKNTSTYKLLSLNYLHYSF